MKNKSNKVLETEKWIDDYILKNGFSPTYDVVAKNFGISKTSAYSRCQRFRNKLVSLKPRNKSTRYFEDLLLKKYIHLAKFYKNYSEYKTHFLSGEVKIPVTDVLLLLKNKQ